MLPVDHLSSLLSENESRAIDETFANSKLKFSSHAISQVAQVTNSISNQGSIVFSSTEHDLIPTTSLPYLLTRQVWRPPPLETSIYPFRTLPTSLHLNIEDQSPS